jgi:hypothetical protein
LSLNPTVRWDTGFFTSMYGDFVFEHTKRGNALKHSFRIRELCVSYHMGQGNSKLLTPQGPGSRTSLCRRAPRPVEVQLSSNTSRYQLERGGGKGAAVGAPARASFAANLSRVPVTHRWPRSRAPSVDLYAHPGKAGHVLTLKISE